MPTDKCPQRNVEAMLLDLRTMRIGVLRRPGAKQPLRYWGKTFPELGKLVTVVHKKCTAALLDISRNQIDLNDLQVLEKLQQLIIVACQVLIPPMRGKPFWSLSLVDNGKNSMQ